MSSDVEDSSVAESDGPEPSRDAQRRGGGDAGQPEPEEREDLLGEEVDGQHALDRVTMHGAQLTHREVAQCDAREPPYHQAVSADRRTRSTARSQVREHLQYRAATGNSSQTANGTQSKAQR